MKLPLFIARRYFFSKNNLSAINIITGISVVSYAVGAFALLSLLSALNGFETAIFSVYETYYPDLKITGAKGKVFETDSLMFSRIQKTPGVRHVSYTLEENAILSNGDHQVVGLVKGVDTVFEKVVRADSLFVAGGPRLKDDERSYGWLAEGLYYKLNLGSESRLVNIMSPSRESSGISSLELMEDELLVSAVIRPGDEMDQQLLITDLAFVRDLFDRQGMAGAIEIRTDGKTDLSAVAASLRKITGPDYYVRDRREQNQAVYRMFNTEKWVAFAIMAFVLLIISFNLVGSLSMLIIEKRKDIGILRAMGMAAGRLRQIFFSEGVIIAMSGAVTGLIGGIAVVLLQQKYGFIQTNATFVSAYPVELRFADIVLVLGLCLTIGVGVSVYPSWKSPGKQ